MRGLQGALGTASVAERVSSAAGSAALSRMRRTFESATISFGQMLPTAVLEESIRLAEASDLFLAIGSSLVVHPAAGLPEVARAGARLVIINRDPTDQDASANAVIREPIGETLAAIDGRCKRPLSLDAFRVSVPAEFSRPKVPATTGAVPSMGHSAMR